MLITFAESNRDDMDLSGRQPTVGCPAVNLGSRERRNRSQTPRIVLDVQDDDELGQLGMVYQAHFQRE